MEKAKVAVEYERPEVNERWAMLRRRTFLLVAAVGLLVVPSASAGADRASRLKSDFVLASFNFNNRPMFDQPLSVSVNAWTHANGRSEGQVVIKGFPDPSPLMSPACIAVSGNEAEVTFGLSSRDSHRPETLLITLYLRDNRGTNQPDEALIPGPPPFNLDPVPHVCPFSGAFFSLHPIVSGDINIHDG